MLTPKELRLLSRSVKTAVKRIGREEKMIYFRTGCKLIDLVVGGNKGVYGFPAGKFINIVGDKSAGKTFLANEIIASNYRSQIPRTARCSTFVTFLLIL